MTIERREHKRIAVDFWVKEEEGDFFYTFKAGNISEKGMFLNNKIASDDRSRGINRYTFFVPELNKSITLEGLVVHSQLNTKDRTGRGAGILFQNLSPETEKDLKELIQQTS